MAKKEDRYFFPAVLAYEPGREIAVEFPDLGVATRGVDDRDAMLSARELLGAAIWGMEQDGEEVPEPTPLAEVELAENERACLVDVFMPAVRAAAVNRSVTRTVTIPAWLDAEAREQGVNFSQALQDALKELVVA